MGDVPLRELVVRPVRRAGVAWKGELMGLGPDEYGEGEELAQEGYLPRPGDVPWGLGFATRRCPRCGEMVYADMRVCYGCLFDFSRLDGQGGMAPEGEADPVGTELAGAAPAGMVPAREVGRKGLRAAVPEVTAGPGEASGPDRVGMGPGPGQGADVLAVIGPAAGGGPGAEDGGGVSVPVSGGGLRTDGGGAPGFYLTSASVDVWVPVRPGGSMLGRDPACDVVLHAPAVSRRHAFLRARADGMEVTDLGATNPARFRGEQVDGRQLVPWGQTLDLCGYALTMTGPPSG